ncbi:hypothetical protein HYV79_02140 [Candidatus Woesearchaeota archaeon]|nr:hypothetical protein [Candidatus Woesearchaeota archaeon]
MKQLSWQAKTAILFVFVFVLLEFYFFSQLKHLPGPYYGGDLYAHHGFAINYLENSFWTCPYFKGELAFYPWLGNYLFILIPFLTGISLMKAVNFTPIITTILASIAYWYLGKSFFKNNNGALLTLLFYWALRGIPQAAPNNLAWMITIPFWYAFWFKHTENPSIKYQILAGLFMGLTSLVQIAFFLAGLMPMLLVLFVNLLREKNIIKLIKNYWLLFSIGFIISLPFYGPLFYKYSYSVKNPLFQRNGPDIDTLGISWALSNVSRMFFNTSNWYNFILGLASLSGFILSILNWKNKLYKTAVLLFIGGIITPLHHLITRPLLGRWVLPGHLWGTGMIALLFTVITIIFLHQKLSTKYKKLFLIGITLLLVILFQNRLSEYSNDRWVQFGEQLDANTQNWLLLGDWVKENTNVNTVFLAHDEGCFAMNGVSGRKCVFVRRTHANYFVDVDERYADGIVLLFGNEKDQTQELLEKYEVEYFLVEPMLLTQPMIVLLEYKEYLQKNGVKFIETSERLDPADAAARKFDVLVVLPPTQGNQLNQHLSNLSKEIISYNIGNQKHLALYKINPQNNT